MDVPQARGDGLGASEIAEAIGVCPPSWGAPIKLWLEKTGREQRREAGEEAFWGQALEPVIRGVYIKRHNLVVRVPRASLYHPAKPWLRATPDGIASEEDGLARHLVQIKNIGPRTAADWGTEERREVPPYYLTQAVAEMAVTGLDACTFAVLIAGQHYFEATVHRDHELEADILDAATAFWTCVETDRPPPVDGSAEYGRYLSTLLAAKSKKVIEAGPDLDAEIGRWRDVRRQLADLELEESTIKNRIMAAAVDGQARRVSSSHGMVPIVESATVRTDWAAMAHAYAKRLGINVQDDVDEYTTRSPYAFVRAPHGWKG